MLTDEQLEAAAIAAERWPINISCRTNWLSSGNRGFGKVFVREAMAFG